MRLKDFCNALFAFNANSLNDVEVFIEYPFNTSHPKDFPVIQKKVEEVALTFSHNDEDGHEHYKIVIR